MCNLIVFDLDGTLADTINGIMYSANIALLNHGFREQNRSFYVNAIGHGAKGLVKKAINSDRNKDDIVDNVFIISLNYYSFFFVLINDNFLCFSISQQSIQKYPYGVSYPYLTSFSHFSHCFWLFIIFHKTFDTTVISQGIFDRFLY